MKFAHSESIDHPATSNPSTYKENDCPKETGRRRAGDIPEIGGTNQLAECRFEETPGASFRAHTDLSEWERSPRPKRFRKRLFCCRLGVTVGSHLCSWKLFVGDPLCKVKR